MMKETTNATCVSVHSIPTLAVGDFRAKLIERVGAGDRVSSFFGAKLLPATVSLFAVLADDVRGCLKLFRTEVEGGEFPSITPDCAQVHHFEREIAEQFGLKPVGHPWLKPVRYPDAGLPGVGDFYRVEGDQVHEVAVGPVHAGVIEPGHFRFQCHGEQVFHLEIALGYQHRGVERALSAGPDARSLHYAETLSGDTTIGHATAYSRTVEALCSCKESAKAQQIRGIALELERLANHTGDMGALSGDVGYLPTASFCGRIRGDFLNMSALLCGNRFGRGLVRPGGVAFDLEEARIGELAKRLKAAEKDATNAIKLLWDNQSVMARFEDTGTLPKEIAIQLGIVGPAARAADLSRDVRRDHPTGIYRFSQVPVASMYKGDVYARAYVRWKEMQNSIDFIRDQLGAVPRGAISEPIGTMAPDSLAVTLTEGWRGEICHVALTDDKGSFVRYKVVDPSFHNWYALAYVLRNQEISDFPLCNKSFNLSYCGHDL